MVGSHISLNVLVGLIIHTIAYPSNTIISSSFTPARIIMLISLREEGGLESMLYLSLTLKQTQRKKREKIWND